MNPTTQKSVIAIGFSLAAFGCYRSAPEAAPRPFQITTVAAEAIEGGPCVIDVKLSNQGTQPFCNRYGLEPDVVLPGNWAMLQPHSDEVKSSVESSKHKFTFTSGVMLEEGPQLINPGKFLQKRCHLHCRSSTQIVSGKARLYVSWPMIQIKDKSPTLSEDELRGYAPPPPVCFGSELFRNWDETGNFSTYLDLDVLPANPKNLSALRERLEQRLMPGASAEEIEDVANHLYSTRHCLLSPIAWRIIEGSYCSTVDYPRLFQVVDESTSEWEEVETRLIRLANNPTYGPRWLVFKYLAERNPAMSGNAVAALTSSDSVWTRVLTYLWFRKRCERLWATDLLSSLPELTQPLPQSDFANLLRDLDDDDFRVREQAMARLIGFGERVESQFKGASHHLLSLEAKRRVRLILERIAAKKGVPEWKPIVEHLSFGDCDRDAADAVLRALAKGNADAALTKAAVAGLNQLTTPK